MSPVRATPEAKRTVLAMLAAIVALGCEGSLAMTDREASDGGVLSDSALPADAGAASDASTVPATDASAPPDAGAAGPPDSGPPDAGPPAPLPLPDESGTVDALAAERPDLLAASCVEHGGNNDFLFELVRRLRAVDDRWGLNWKRGVVGDMSQDVVDYHFGHGEREGSTEVYIIDVIGGHCGDSPSPAWIDQTEATRAGGTIGMWTLAGRTDL